MNKEHIAANAEFNFSDTKTTFSDKSVFDLRKSAFLFQIMSNTKFVTRANRLAMAAASIGLPISWAVKPTIYKQFVGGETLADCRHSVEQLAKKKIMSILDYSAEAASGRTNFDKVMNETLASIDHAASHSSIPFAVFKPTAIAEPAVLRKVSFGEQLTDEEHTKLTEFSKRMEVLASRAAKNDVSILVDAEDYWYQKAIDEVVLDMMKKFNRTKAIVYNTWQMYRHDRLENLRKVYQLAEDQGFYVGAKFVRGAYMEKERDRALEGGYPSPIQPNKAATDRNYDAALQFAIEKIHRIRIFNGTHNELSTSYLAGLMIEAGLEPKDERIWFAQLFGMSDHITTQLAIKGYNVAKYVPYGPVKEVLPYLSRRAEENTSIKGQTGRELGLIKKEIARRKASA